MVQQDHCPWCKKLKTTTLQDKDVIAELDKNYVFVLLNKKNKLPKGFEAPVSPMLFIVNSKGEMLHEIIGYVSGKQLLEEFDLAFMELE